MYTPFSFMSYPQPMLFNNFGWLNPGNFYNSMPMPTLQMPSMSDFLTPNIQQESVFGNNLIYNSTNICDLNSYSQRLSYNNMDTFNFTTKPKEKKEKKEAVSTSYSSKNDIYANANKKYLSKLTSDMQDKTKQLIAYANKNGYDVQIISGYRTQAEQKELQKKYQNEPGRVAKNSAHCAGKAIDIKVTKNGEDSDAGYNLLGDYAKSKLGMRWGGDFSSYRERWHFDYGWKTA